MVDARTATLNDGSASLGPSDEEEDLGGFAVGQIIAHDKYRLDELLGSGGMGVVFGATHLALDERVAIKLLRPGLARDKMQVARFLREARASVKLKSPHVARVTDVDELESGDPYIVMEWLDGENLASKLDREGPQPIHDVARWLKETCTAIAEAHALGIIHRDLKPANLFLAKSGAADQRATVKVLDFGVSRILDDSGVVRGLDTSANLVVGTPHYMAPEQHEGARKADARSDVWALGVIAYELLTGAVPYRGDTPAVVYATILTAEAPSPRSRRAEVPIALEAIITKCIQRDPDKRFQTVAELARALDEVLISSSPNLPVETTTAPNLLAPISVSKGVVEEKDAQQSTPVGVTPVASPSRRAAFLGVLGVAVLGTLIGAGLLMHHARNPDVMTTSTSTSPTATLPPTPSSTVSSVSTTPPPPAASSMTAPSSTAPAASSSHVAVSRPVTSPRPRPTPAKSAGPPAPGSSGVDESYKHRTSF